MILSTHRAAETSEHPHPSIWSIAIIIIISALLAVLVEPLFPDPVLAAHTDAAATQAASDDQ